MILLREILEKVFALADHSKKTSAGAVILLVGTHVLRDFRNALGKKGDLHFRRSGVTFFAGEFSDDFCLFCFFHDFRYLS